MRVNLLISIFVASIAVSNPVLALVPLPSCYDDNRTEYWSVSEVQDGYFLYVVETPNQSADDPDELVLSNCHSGKQLHIDYYGPVQGTEGKDIYQQILGFIESDHVYTLDDMAHFFVRSGFPAEVREFDKNICVCSLEDY